MVGLYIFVLMLVATTNNLEGRDEATILIGFATITGVLAGLYFVIRQTKRVQQARPMVMTWLLISLLLSLASSIHSLSIPFDSAGSKVLFVASAFAFAGSTSLFAIKTGLLSETT